MYKKPKLTERLDPAQIKGNGSRLVREVLAYLRNREMSVRIEGQEEEGDYDGIALIVSCDDDKKRTAVLNELGFAHVCKSNRMQDKRLPPFCRYLTDYSEGNKTGLKARIVESYSVKRGNVTIDICFKADKNYTKKKKEKRFIRDMKRALKKGAKIRREIEENASTQTPPDIPYAVRA